MCTTELVANSNSVFKGHFYFYRPTEMLCSSKNLYLFYKTNCFLSNFHPSVFTIDGVTFSSVEQYFQYEKARLFSDIECMQKIMQTNNPKEQKFLGNSCKRYDDNVWNLASINVMKKGLMAKFQQNEYLGKKLLATNGLYLAEASATDCKWGIGFGLGNPQANDLRKWRGQNLLGKLLMEVRDSLM